MKCFDKQQQDIQNSCVVSFREIGTKGLVVRPMKSFSPLGE
jgi:hypothetical protein